MAEAPKVKARATYDDILALPEHQVGEIIDGDLHVSPRPRSRHALATTALLARLGPAFHSPGSGDGGWWILVEPELHFGQDVSVPDFGGWRRERMPEFPDVAFFTLAPDWVCEILSPSTAPVDRGHKLRIYGREGVAHVWLLDPEARTLEVMRRLDQQWLLVGVHEGRSKVRAEPFDAVELDLAPLWGEAATP
jgi:Uma2 family endonuclease